ncbi:PepSY-associated TM helix domain-containing protein [Methylobacterium oxalidis]|uniref:PepSY domain-containing protein n=1 Tax=Methylobacterium oxalidis TaxID=944322 RepID=A0A512J278_9HYPH|nr:PepSY-associated TM helix domain-containing protein [Methylobacterium oxalidis]GEP04055.1 hypothetical protein MOX02_20930 [Methylobacterium oxalidis]GJE33209.1 hypothetical protein LDDCCGHA_3408 [Methylobacterium oxalidis]GLS65116.1 hypothetical protein GCM10007888_34970 [Methylobacterium oxalidis]
MPPAVATSAEPSTSAVPRGRSRLRTLWRRVHLSLGLVAGLILAVVGASGAALVFAEPIVRAEHGPALFPDGAPPSPAWPPVEAWMARAKARHPELETILVVAAPHAAPLPAAVPLVAGHLRHDPGAPEEHGVVAVDVASGDPRGFIVIERSWWGFLVHLHAALMVPPYGLFATAVAGILFLISAATGVYLWWPRNDRTWRQALTVKSGASGRRLLLDWHNVLAVWLLVPLTAAILSGVYLLRPMWFDWALAGVSTLRAPAPGLLAPAPEGACPGGAGPDRALAVARAAYPDLSFRLLIMPEKAGAPYQLSLAPPDAPHRVQSTELWIARDCPRLLFARTGNDLSAAETLKSWISPIHARFALGPAGQALMVLVGLSLPALFVTGLWLWIAKFRARARRG